MRSTSPSPCRPFTGGDQAKRGTLSLEEGKRLVAAADDEWKGLILCGLYTGQRLGDIARLTWNLIDLERQEITFLTGKTGRRIILPLAKPLHEYLLSQLAPNDSKAPVFAHAYQVVTVQNRVGSLSNRFYDLMVQAGLGPPRKHRKAKEGREGKRQSNTLSFHCLRHTATSLLKNAGVSEAVAMDIIGHESKAVSANYTHIEDSTKRKALDELPNILSD